MRPHGITKTLMRMEYLVAKRYTSTICCVCDGKIRVPVYEDVPEGYGRGWWVNHLTLDQIYSLIVKPCKTCQEKLDA